MSKGILLHPKHGVNPTIPICFWCGEDRNEVVLLGAAYKKRAPMHMCIDHEPCDECKKKMAQGITLMEATNNHGEREVTGRWVVVTEEGIRKMFQPESVVESVLRHRKAHIEPEAFNRLLPNFGDAVKI